MAITNETKAADRIKGEQLLKDNFEEYSTNHRHMPYVGLTPHGARTLKNFIAEHGYEFKSVPVGSLNIEEACIDFSVLQQYFAKAIGLPEAALDKKAVGNLLVPASTGRSTIEQSSGIEVMLLDPLALDALAAQEGRGRTF